MITLKLKTTETSGGRATLAHPLAQVGQQRDVIIYHVVDIPHGASIPEVLRAFNATCTVSGYVFKFSDLGAGCIVRGGAAQ